MRELNFSGPSPLLYLVATPIGNMEEMAPRAISILKETDFVAAEDTRNSGALLKKLGIDKPFISCHEHNEEAASQKIVSLLLSGKKVAYMSDAGYPGISDPGSRLVANCLNNGIKVSTISGPNAALNALSASGLDSAHFYFHGFLDAKEGEKEREIGELKNRKETIILYESPHRIKKTLQALYCILGDRKAVIARELTKAHEEYIRGPLSELNELEESTLKGEMVIVIEGDKIKKEISDEDIAKTLQNLLKKEKLSGTQAVKETAKALQIGKNRVYRVYLTLKED